ncbi:MAG: NAD(P)H-dependent glycerol-3-phosphate dehydrogenase [Deltaproteobacteria bacterium]
MNNRPRIAILGDGGWGTALARLLCAKGCPVSMWGAFPEYISYLRRKRENTRFLPGFPMPAKLLLTAELDEALADADIVVLAIPSEYLRGVLGRVKKLGYPRKAVYVSVVKGIEISSLKRMSEVISDELGAVRCGVLSGPTIAREIAAGIPAAAVAASRNEHVRKLLQDVFITDRFRIYTCGDVIGVELGASLKNVIAIACGISDGLGFGTNTKAAILSRGLAEIARLGKAMGARDRTFSGISGLGDLVTTCFSPFSRNRSFGEQIGKGKSPQAIRKSMKMVAEGVPTAKSAYLLGKKMKVELPITEQVYQVIYNGTSPVKAVSSLMTREKKAE